MDNYSTWLVYLVDKHAYNYNVRLLIIRHSTIKQARDPGTSFKCDPRALCGQMSESVSEYTEVRCISIHFI